MALDLAYALAIAVGGAVGACFRGSIYVLASRIQPTRLWAGYPHGTYLANVVGSLVLGLLTGLTISAHLSVEVRDFAGTGFCGSLTTFSTFSNDTFVLVEKRRWPELAAHLFLNLVVGFGAAALGYYVGKQL
jgi:CrcB protein